MHPSSLNVEKVIQEVLEPFPKAGKIFWKISTACFLLCYSLDVCYWCVLEKRCGIGLTCGWTWHKRYIHTNPRSFLSFVLFKRSLLCVSLCCHRASWLRFYFILTQQIVNFFLNESVYVEISIAFY